MLLRNFHFLPFRMANDPGDILPPDDPPPPAARVRELKCEHCDCRLTPTGDVLRMSDTARGHLRSAEKIEKLTARVGELETELRDARAKVAELSTVRESKRSAFDLEL